MAKLRPDREVRRRDEAGTTTGAETMTGSESAATTVNFAGALRGIPGEAMDATEDDGIWSVAMSEAVTVELGVLTDKGLAHERYRPMKQYMHNAMFC